MSEVKSYISTIDVNGEEFEVKDNEARADLAALPKIKFVTEAEYALLNNPKDDVLYLVN